MYFKDKKVLVTGGAGFVGSNLVRRLVEVEQAQVIVLDDFFTGRRNYLAGLGCEIHEGSVCDPKLAQKLVREVDIVFHLAARNIIVSSRNPREDFETNIGGTLNLLMAARESRVEKMVYTSSVSVYGNPRYLPINEDDHIHLLTPYAVSKFGGEGYCVAFYEMYGLPVSIVRYSNVYGYNQDPRNPYCGVVAKFFQSVVNDEPPPIHGDGEQTRDFTFVEDAVEATLLAASSPKAEGEVFNVGTGVETSINTLAHSIIELFGRDLQAVYIDRRDIDNIRRRVVNIEKARTRLRWTPRFPLKKGLMETKKWFDSSDQRFTDMVG